MNLFCKYIPTAIHVMIILIVLPSCALYQESDREIYSEKVREKYNETVQRLTQDLASKLKIKMDSEYVTDKKYSVIISYNDLEKEKCAWNNFLEDFDLAIRKQLAKNNIGILPNDFWFADQTGNSAFNELQIPQNADLPELGINFNISCKEDGIRILTQCVYLNSRLNLFEEPTNLSWPNDRVEQYASNQLKKCWDEEKIQKELSRYLYKGSKRDPFVDVNDVATFFSRVLKFKYKVANEIWRGRFGKSDFDFSKLSFRWAGIIDCNPGIGIKSTLDQAICEKLYNVGLNTTGCDPEKTLLSLTIHSNMDKKKDFLKSSKSQHTMEFAKVPEEAFISGRMRVYSKDKIFVTLSSTIVSSKNGHQGNIIPELGGECYLKCDTTPPESPTNLTIIDCCLDGVTLEWNDDDKEEGVIYKIKKNITPTQHETIATTANNRTIIRSTQSDYDFSYSVVSVDSNGNESAPSEPLYIPQDCPGKFLSINGIPVYLKYRNEKNNASKILMSCFENVFENKYQHGNHIQKLNYINLKKPFIQIEFNAPYKIKDNRKPEIEINGDSSFDIVALPENQKKNIKKNI